MLKKDELANPNSCWNKAKDTDLVFVLIQKDITMANTIREWCQLRIDAGKNVPGDGQILEAQQLADRLDAIHFPSDEGIDK